MATLKRKFRLSRIGYRRTFSDINLDSPPTRPVSFLYRGLPIHIWRVSKKDGVPIFSLDVMCCSTGIRIHNRFKKAGGWDYVEAGDFNNHIFQKLLWTEIDWFIYNRVQKDDSRAFDVELVNLERC